MDIIAIILAGGTGKRMNASIPKQFLKISDKPVIQYSIEAFSGISGLSHIIVVCHPYYFDQLSEISNTTSLNFTTIAGGKTRNESSLNAINYIQKTLRISEAKLLFHDAARPNVSVDIIHKMSETLDTHRVAVTVGPIFDTLYHVNNKQEFDGIQNREFIVKAHTPQAFHLSVIADAYRLYLTDKSNVFTDDVSLVNHYFPHIKIQLIEDDFWNIKLTRPMDFKVLEVLLNR
jgi:2-C-methyl-D-erythritol 4-phosphate cytidylyltransferase